MTQRITQKDLQAVVDRINRETNNPQTTWIKEDGKNKSQYGNYHIDSAYSGYQLVRVVNPHGGVENVLNCGFVSKRELYDLMHAYIQGIECGKNGGKIK